MIANCGCYYAGILKERRHALAPILKTIFCSSLLTGIVPRDWRTAKIIPSLQKREANYKPISLTSLVSKLFEKIMAFHITNHLESL